MKQISVPTLASKTLKLVRKHIDQFKSLKPWTVLEDGDLFGVKCPRTGQLGFVSVLTDGDRCDGLMIYCGRSGFRNFADSQVGSELLGEDEFVLDQDSIFLEFPERDSLEPMSLEMMRSLGVNIQDVDHSPPLKRARPSYMPWFLEEDDAALFISAMEVMPLVLAKVAVDPDFVHGENGDFFPLYSFENGVWTYEWVKKVYFMDPDPSEPIRLVPRGPDATKSDQNKIQFGGTWELGLFNLPLPVADDFGRPSLPKVCVVMDGESGLALHCEVTEAADDSFQLLRETLLKAIDLSKRSPQFLLMSNEHLLVEMARWASPMAIEVHGSKLKHLESFKSELLEEIEGSAPPKKAAKAGASPKKAAKGELYYEFEVSLLHVEPRLWRRFQIKASATFEDLHDAIQAACSWENDHLFEFRTKYGSKGAVIWGCDSSVTPEEIELSEYFEHCKKCVYIYDFGDEWRHEIKLIKKLNLEESFDRRLTGGERSFPMEDCGGVYGYFRCLDVLSGDAEDEELEEWIGDWTPDGFQLEEVQAEFNC
jgi:hypothetical protein